MSVFCESYHLEDGQVVVVVMPLCRIRVWNVPVPYLLNSCV